MRSSRRIRPTADGSVRFSLSALLVEPAKQDKLREIIEQDKSIIRPFIEQYCALWSTSLKEAEEARAGRRMFDKDKLYSTYQDIVDKIGPTSDSCTTESIWTSSLAHALSRSTENLYKYACGEISLHEIPNPDIPSNAVVSFITGINRERGTYKPEDFLEILDRVCLPRKFKIEKSPDAWRCHIGSSNFHIITIGNIIEAVMSQLIQNAADAVDKKYPAGGSNAVSAKRIFLSENGLENGGLEIKVRDSGTGIPADILPRISDKGFSTKGAGRGMGLSSCKELMEIVGGSITIESVYGEGTTVTLVVPKEFVERVA